MTWRDWKVLISSGNPTVTYFNPNRGATAEPNVSGAAPGEDQIRFRGVAQLLVTPKYDYIRDYAGVRRLVKPRNEGVMSCWGYQTTSSSGVFEYRVKYIDSSNYYRIVWQRAFGSNNDIIITKVKAGVTTSVFAIQYSPHLSLPLGVWHFMKVQWRWTSAAKTAMQFKIWTNDSVHGALEITPSGTGVVDNSPLADSADATIAFGGLDQAGNSFFAFYDGLRIDPISDPPL